MVKRWVSVIVALSMIAVFSAALAETPKEKGPEVIKLKMADFELPFTHWQHQKDLNNECYHCHSKKIGKIEGWSKDTAHIICIACHELEGKGPASCRQCHTKQKQ